MSLDALVNGYKKTLIFQSQLHRMKDKIVRAMSNPAFVEEVPSHRPDALFKTCFRFSCLNNVELPNAYWRLVILVNHIVSEFCTCLSSRTVRGAETGQIRQSDTAWAATNICKSLEFCLDFKPLGPASMLYNLLAAYTASEEQCKDWIAKMLVTEVMDALPVKGTILDLASRYLGAVRLEGEVSDLKDRIRLVMASQSGQTTGIANY